MHLFEVWSPVGSRVDVRIGETSFPMQHFDDGWWRCEIENAGPGTEYFFVIDGGEATPDPRSESQPYGIHGPSCLIDHSAFAWTDRNWQPRPLASAIIYELHIGTFTPQGTFRSAIERLGYLADLGVTHIELMPVNEFSGAWGWGYDGVDL
ncbi:MAG: malto-oligosyltrehalose trehalohydrolase, partial [Acidobacteriaceae bacterium]|nr:malto-oligosyltrehalose trehalohydrolase [Acidobacteriaceae bacterium]